MSEESNPKCQVLLYSKIRCNKPGTARWLLRHTEKGTLTEIWVCKDHEEVPIS